MLFVPELSQNLCSHKIISIPLKFAFFLPSTQGFQRQKGVHSSNFKKLSETADKYSTLDMEDKNWK